MKSSIYAGIDVGAGKYFLAYYSTSKGRQVQFERFKSRENNNLAEICKRLKEINPKHIAIDAPAKLCPPGVEKRECEVLLSIGGYFKTPKKKAQVQGWMRSGFDLWDWISAQKLEAVEVHPTLIFKKIKNPKAEARQWIMLSDPPSKKSRKGKELRKTILKEKGLDLAQLPGTNTDLMDAAIAAFTAEQVSQGKCIYRGDDAGGFIYFPR